MALVRPPALRVLEPSAALAPVRRAAAALGLRLTGGDDYDVLWSYRSPYADASLAERLRAGRVANHYPGTAAAANRTRTSRT